MVRVWNNLGARMRVLVGVGLALLLIVGLAVAWYLGSPLFLNRVVNEAFPVAAPVVQNSAVTTGGAQAAIAPTAPAQSDLQAGAGTVATAIPDAAAVEVVALSSGSFTEIDAIHRGEGQATIYRLEDGRLLLRFEPDFRVQNGPDLFVHLSRHPLPRSSEELHEGGDINLGALKGNQGSQNYELPADIDLSQYQSVVIYCRAFGVVFSTAELLPIIPTS